MNPYEIIITPDSEADLYEIRDYIAYTLLVPETALEYVRSIRSGISKLSFAALSIAPVVQESWHSRGIRKITAKNFLVYYRIDETSNRVYILDVIYAKRDQIKVLEQMKTED